jgi:shikimate dehydrogenase
MAALRAGASYVDLPFDSDAELIELVPKRSRILSWHGGHGEKGDLFSILSRMQSIGAAMYKLVPSAAGVADLGPVRDFLKESRKKEPSVICFASGRFGALSRILAPSWGSRWTYGYPAGGRPTAPGQFRAEDLIELYNVPEIGGETVLIGLLGGDLAGSPSPAMHNAALRDLGIDARYLPMEIETIADFRFLTDPDGPIAAGGTGVTMPFKRDAARLAVHLDSWSTRAGAVNTLVRSEEGWRGYNTDAKAIRDLAGSLMQVRNRKVLVYGAGGTARASVVAMKDAGGSVTLVGRNRQRVQQLAEELDVDFVPEWTDRVHADVLVNATPVGKRRESWPATGPLPGKMVIDAPYGAQETDLVRKAREAGLKVVSGRELILAQAVDQFRLLVGHEPDCDVMATAMKRWFERPNELD